MDDHDKQKMKRHLEDLDSQLRQIRSSNNDSGVGSYIDRAVRELDDLIRLFKRVT